MSGLATYFRERFPLPSVAVLSIGIACLLCGVADSSDWYLETSKFGRMPFFATFIFFFLLRTRITDEFKDSRHDQANYPNRPLQRGAISKSTLFLIGFFAFIAEVVFAGFASFFGGENAVLWYLAILFYSLLTAFEFFVPVWLNRHFNTYFVLHQFIFVLFVGFALETFRSPLYKYNLLAAVGFVLFLAVVEIARKYELRRDSAGQVVKDSYLAVWGKQTSLAVVVLLTALGAWFFSLQKHSFLPWLVELVMLSLIYLVNRKPKFVQGAIMIGFLSQSVLVFLL